MEAAFVKMPYTGARNVPELSAGPAYLDCAELHEMLREVGVGPVPAATVCLDDGQEAEYGQWQRMGLACGNLATLVADQSRQGRFVIGLRAATSPRWWPTNRGKGGSSSACWATARRCWGCSRGCSAAKPKASRAAWGCSFSTRTPTSTPPIRR
jgi:hypothetical protein